MVFGTFSVFMSAVAALFTNGLDEWFHGFISMQFNELALGGVIILLSFVMTLFLTKKWIVSANATGLVGKDMNKTNRPLVPRSGGLVVVIAICFSLLIYIFLKSFALIGTQYVNVLEVLAITATVLLAGFIGFIDDVLGWKTGLSQMQKVVLTIPIALPLTVIDAGISLVEVPFVGSIDLGLFYPLLIVPLGVIGATNGFNLLAGYNGLETSMGLVIFASFGFTSLLVGRLWIALICFIVYASLLAFLAYNWYPAKVFPGNSFSYAIGALIATLAILGSMEKLAVWLFIPYFCEILLYFRARAIDRMGDVQAFAIPNEDGSLELPYNHVYDMTHVAISVLKRFKTKVYEKDVVLFLIVLQILFAVSGILLLR